MRYKPSHRIGRAAAVMLTIVMVTMAAAPVVHAQARETARAPSAPAPVASTSSPYTPAAFFYWPDQLPDIGTYGTVDRCLAIINHMELLAERRRVRQDTLPMSARSNDPQPADLVDAARRCSANVQFDRPFARDTVYMFEADRAYQLLLFAARTNEARAFASRWLGAVPAADEEQRAVVLATLASRLVQSRPAQIGEARAHMDSIHPVKHLELRFQTLSMIYGRALDVGDTLAASQIAESMLRDVGRLPDSVTKSDRWQLNPNKRGGGLGEVMVKVLQKHRERELLDSLRVNTQAYFRHQSTLRTLMKLPPEVRVRSARPIVGEAWFPQRPARGRPTPGVVSVVLTTPDNDCRSCAGPIAMIRRLSARFPSVEFTLLANTKGYHGLVLEPPSLAYESVLIDSVFRKTRGLPAVTAIHHRRFWRLPDHDQRRVNEPSPNQSMYWIDDGILLNPGVMYLIDREGKIVTGAAWVPRTEEEFTRLVEAVVEQGR